MTSRGWDIKSKKRLLAFLTLTGVFLVCFGLAVYGFLRSSYVQKRVIASIRQPLTELGVELRFDDFEVDVFAGFNFVNLRLKIDAPPTIRADIAIEKARLRYGFWALIRQKLELDYATLKGFQGSISLQLPPAKEIQAKKELSPRHLLNLIKKPSFTLAVPNIDVNDIKLHVNINQGENFTEFDIKETEVSSQISLQPDVLKIKLRAAIIASARRTLTNTRTAESTKTMISFDGMQARPDLSLEITTPDDHLNINLEVEKSQFQLDGFLLSSTTSKPLNQSKFQIQKLSIHPKFKLSRSEKFNPESGWIELLKSLRTNGRLDILATNLGLEQKETVDKISNSNSLSLDQMKLQQRWDVSLGDRTSLAHDTWSIDHTTNIKGMNLKQSKGLKTDVQSITFNTTSDVKEGHGSLKTRLTVEQFANPLFAKPASLEQISDLDIKINEGAISGNIFTKLNEAKILDARINASDDGGNLRWNLDFNSVFPKSITELMPQTSSLSNLGWPEIKCRLSLSIAHPIPWNKFHISDWPQLESTLQGSLNILPSSKVEQKPSLSFKSAQSKIDMSLAKREPGKNHNKFESEITTEVTDVIGPAVTAPSAIASKTVITANVGQESKGEIHHNSTVDSESFITMNAKWVDKVKLFTADHDLDIRIPGKLIEKLREPGFLAAIGKLSLKGKSAIEVNHPKSSIISMNKNDLSQTTAKADFAQSIEQKNDPSMPATISIKRPIKAQSTAILDHGSLAVRSQIDGSALAYGKIAEASGIAGTIVANLNNIQEPTRAFFDARFGIKAINFLTTNTPGFDRSLRDLSLSAQSSLNGDTITVSSIEGGLKDGTIRLQGNGEFKISGSGQFDGQITSRLLQDNAVISGSGQFKSPVKLILFDSQRLSFEAKPSFENFSVKAGEFAAKNVNGEVAILEELQIDKTGKIGFLYLKTQNPFARVDYENVEPYLENKSRLMFDEISWKHIVVGPMIQSFEVRQNLVLLNDLKIDLLDGSMVGRFYLDLHPSRLRTGFLGRFSGIKPELLKSPDQRTAEKDWAAFAGRMAVDFDMRKRLASGRMDFTQIGKKQLLSLLDVIDPELKDNQIAFARKGLKIAYPKKVGVSMDHGLMDLTIDLDGALSQTVGVRSLPLSALINAQAGEALSSLETMIN